MSTRPTDMKVLVAALAATSMALTSCSEGDEAPARSGALLDVRYGPCGVDDGPFVRGTVRGGSDMRVRVSHEGQKLGESLVDEDVAPGPLFYVSLPTRHPTTAVVRLETSSGYLLDSQDLALAGGTRCDGTSA